MRCWTRCRLCRYLLGGYLLLEYPLLEYPLLEYPLLEYPLLQHLLLEYLLRSSSRASAHEGQPACRSVVTHRQARHDARVARPQAPKGYSAFFLLPGPPGPEPLPLQARQSS